MGPASKAVLPEVVAFLRGHGPTRQLYPAYSLDDFTGGATLRGLAAEDMMVAGADGAIAGVMAVWNQMSYKQDIVEAYGPALARLRPVYNARGASARCSAAYRTGAGDPAFVRSVVWQ